MKNKVRKTKNEVKRHHNAHKGIRRQNRYTRWLYFCGDESVVEDAIIIELEELTDDSKTI